MPRGPGAYERLSPTERLAADYFLEHVGSFYGTSIAQLSAESGVSQVSWVRFCKSAGGPGQMEAQPPALLHAGRIIDQRLFQHGGGEERLALMTASAGRTSWLRSTYSALWA